MALCSYSDVETFLQIDVDSALQTNLTNTFIPYVDASIKRFLGYDVEQATFTEVFDGEEKKEGPKKVKLKDPDTIDLEKKLTDILGLDVTISHRGKQGGSLKVAYKSLDQLELVTKKLRS